MWRLLLRSTSSLSSWRSRFSRDNSEPIFHFHSQVAALACFNHKPRETEDDHHHDCQLERASYAVPNVVKVKLKPKDVSTTTEDIYANLPVIHRADDVVPEERQHKHVVKLGNNKSEDGRSDKKTGEERGVTIECHRLNKNKVLEKINVEVSEGVFEALRDMNPHVEVRNTLSRTWSGQPSQHSGQFSRENSVSAVQELKSAVQWLRSLKSCNKYKFSKTKVTSL